MWRQLKRPSKDEWVKKMGYLYTVKYYSAIKKNEIVSLAATWLGLEVIILQEVSQKERQIYDIIYRWNLKYDTNELISETKTGSQT